MNWIDYASFVRALALLFFLDWLFYLPFFKIAFSLHDSAGAARGDRVYTLLLSCVWGVSIVALASSYPLARLLGAGVLTAVFRYYFISLRWKSVRRGSGAPGFMSHWAIRYVFLIELLKCIDSTGQTLQTLFFVIRWDFAWIMVCAGTYKILVGYLKNNGMEYGQVNPIWGYQWAFFKKQSPYGLIPKMQNFFGCVVEVAAGILMLIPHPIPQIIGALSISVSFIYVSFFIRLGRLAYFMVVLPFIFFPSVLETALTAHPAWKVFSFPEGGLFTLNKLLIAYVVLLPIIKVMQYLNLFKNYSFPAPFQNLLAQFANWVPIIMWRVFTVDVTDFFTRIWACDETGKKTLCLVNEDTFSLTEGNWSLFKLRFLNVTESIASTSVFTTLKYAASSRTLFDDKLVRYARSIEKQIKTSPPLMCFEYIKIGKTSGGFEFTHIGDFTVDFRSNLVSEKKYVAEFDYSAPAPFSPVRESIAAGFLLPKDSGKGA